MAEPEKDLDALRKEQEKEDADLLDDLERESKQFDKDSEIERILGAFRANAYDVLDLQPGVPDEDIKKTYRKKSLLIHPDKTSNPRAPDAFDRLAGAHQALLDETKRGILDEAIADARSLLIRERKLTKDSEEVKDPDREFMTAWKNKVKYVLADNEARRARQAQAAMRDEGRQQRKEEEELAAKKRKRDHEQDWEKTRESRIGNWRDFQKKEDAKKTKKKKMKVLG
ncbi:hypothetical protein Q7P37_007306 [Cladosporium fusiforme]